MKKDILSYAKKVLKIEFGALKDQLKHISNSFFDAVELIVNCPGKLVVMGIGKSGLIGRKIASTFASLGTPAVFVHPAELLHGDLGIITKEDVLLILSYSGELKEVKEVFPHFQSIGLRTILMTGRINSMLAKLCSCIVNVEVKREACLYDLAPTASTTAMLAMGDALALAVAKKKRFKKEDFAKYHPGGMIGKKLSIKVENIMRCGKDNPKIMQDRMVKDALIVMTKTRLGATSVVDKAGYLVGYFTDGDLRRGLQKDKQLLRRKLYEVMTRRPKTITKDKSGIEAAQMMKKYNCDNLPVVDSKGRPIGIVDERDLIALGLI